MKVPNLQAFPDFLNISLLTNKSLKIPNGGIKMKNIFLLSLIAIALVGCSSMNIQGKKNKNDDAKEDVPFLTKAKVKKKWVKDEIKGKKYITGHWIYIIEEQSEWSKERGK